MDKLFPYNIYKFKVPNYKELNKKLITEVYKMKEKEELGVRTILKSNVGGWHSSLDSSNFKYLSEIICNFFSKEILDTEDKIDISSIWANVNGKNDYNRHHVHTFGYYVGAYYVRVPENSGKLYILNPCSWNFASSGERHADELYGCKDDEKEYNIQEGDLYFFNGQLPHRVGKNLTDKDRISIAFNFDYKDLERQWMQK